MPESKITFHCPQCATRLSVEAALAGVTGPCPSCHRSIQAPFAVEQPAAPVDGSGADPGHPRHEAELMPAIPPPDETDFPKIIHHPSPQAQADPDDAMVGESAGQTELALAPADDGRPDPADLPEAQGQKAAPRFLNPWVGAMAAVLVLMTYVIVDSVRMSQQQNRAAVPTLANGSADAGAPELAVAAPPAMWEPPQAELPPALPVAVEVKLPPLPPIEVEAGLPPALPVVVQVELPPLPPAVVEVELPSLPPAVVEVEPLADPEPAFLEVDAMQFSDLDAKALLVKFLTAQSLRERWPMMLSAADPQTLLGGCLDAPLPEVSEVQLEYLDNQPDRGFCDSFYAVVFKGGDVAAAPHTVVVRQHQGHGPRVLADPFLDLYGGRLAAFIARPCKGEGVFAVVVSARAGCRDPAIPLADRKMTLELMARDHGESLGRAYFNKDSAIARLLEDGTFRLSYGNPTACKLSLRWNRTESPGTPFLEALAIKDFGWGPR